MENENMVGLVIMVLCCWSCAGLFFGIGFCAQKQEKPMHFWAGTTIDPRSITNIPAYNLENARMWMLYSIPYWLAGAVVLFFRGSDFGTIAAVILLLAACVPGIPMLIAHYRRIERKYIKTQSTRKMRRYE